MGARAHSEEEYQQMAELREKGWSHGRIAAKFGIHPNAVAWQCLRLGADHPRLATKVLTPNRDCGPVRRGNHIVRPFSAEDDATLVRMEREGARIVEMCRALDRRHNSIVGRLMTLARHQARREAAASC